MDVINVFYNSILERDSTATLMYQIDMIDQSVLIRINTDNVDVDMMIQLYEDVANCYGYSIVLLGDDTLLDFDKRAPITLLKPSLS